METQKIQGNERYLFHLSMMQDIFFKQVEDEQPVNRLDTILKVEKELERFNTIKFENPKIIKQPKRILKL